MIEVELDFDDVSMVPVGVVKIELGDTKIEHIGDLRKEINKENSKIIISNIITATNIVPSDIKLPIHVVSEYKTVETGDIITVHERSFGEVKCVESVVSCDKPRGINIIVEDLQPFYYTMEVKTKEELLEDRIIKLERKVETINSLLIKHSSKIDTFKEKVLEACK